MDSVAAVKIVQKIRQAFQVLAILQITSYLWPQQAILKDGATFDFIVVGAGSAGSVIAARLAEDRKTRVLLIEAGGDAPLETTVPSLMIYLGKSYLDWKYTTEDDGHTQRCTRNHVVDLMLGKMLGGTSSLNFLLYSEGHYRDYDHWAKIVDDETWNWKGVRPFFKKAFKLEQTMNSTNNFYNKGKVGLTKDVRSDLDSTYLNGFREVGYKLVQFINENNTVGYTRSINTIADGVRQSAAYAYLRPIKDYPNLYVTKNTVAKSILFDNNKNAVGVEAVLENGRTVKYKSLKEVIVSAGAINSPKLLMLSGIGPKYHLERKNIKVISDLPVGQNYQDHVGTIVIHNMTKLKGSTKTRDSREYPAHVVTGYVNLDKTKDFPTYSTVNYVNYASYLIQFCTVTYGICGKICDAMFANPNTNQMIFTVVTNLRPKSRGEVLLRSSDYTDAPIVNTGYYSKKEDLENQIKFIEDFVRVTNTTSFKNAGGKLVNPKLSCCLKYEFGSTDYWRCYAKCVTMARRHYAGTNAMGSVVDSELRVKGVKKLRVADASIMPIITSGDTNGPTIMIGEKAADIIKKDYRMGS